MTPVADPITNTRADPVWGTQAVDVQLRRKVQVHRQDAFARGLLRTGRCSASFMWEKNTLQPWGEEMYQLAASLVPVSNRPYGLLESWAVDTTRTRTRIIRRRRRRKKRRIIINRTRRKRRRKTRRRTATTYHWVSYSSSSP